MFARFDENPAMTLQDIEETKRYGRTDGSTDNVKTVYPPQTKFAGGGGYKKGRTGSSESSHVKMPHCCKSHVMAHICFAVCLLYIPVNNFSVMSSHFPVLMG